MSEEVNLDLEHRFYCKNKNSFDNAYAFFLNNPAIGKINVVSETPKKLFKYFKADFKVIKAAGGIVLNNAGNLLVINGRV